MKANGPVALVIMDGFALADPGCANAVYLAKTPHLDEYFMRYPWARLACSGSDVGLMPGQMGDSNVGHLNIGAGRVVLQTLPRIMRSIESGEFFENRVLISAVKHARRHNTALHLMGLLSDGGVHSHIAEVYALLELAERYGPVPVYIHAFLDGRDVPPQSAISYLKELEQRLEAYPRAQLASLAGRYYAMDRDKRWERTDKALAVLLKGHGASAEDALQAIERSYAAGITDEFVEPTVIMQDNGEPVGIMRPGDAVIFFNFRADRARQLSYRLVEQGDVYLVGMVEYDDQLDIPAAFLPQQIINTLGEVVSQSGLRQLRIAETEKYAHVTFFFNGGREEPFPGEERILVPSPKVATYDLKPEMSAFEVTERAIDKLKSGSHELLVLNYANCDMVGHTGRLPAAVAAVEAVDACLGKLVAAVRQLDGSAVITADHGNAEQMYDSEQKPHTTHTSNQVPCIVIADNIDRVRASGRLADVAPTVLELMGVPQPAEMTGTSLIIR